MFNYTTKTIANFWKHVNISDNPDNCWEWVGSRNKGYGIIRINGKLVKAHRVSYELKHNKEIPKGLVIRHNCDNPKCVNPNHLSIGTQLDNIRDRDHKGRQSRGENKFSAKLTWEQVREIRKRYADGGVTHRSLANDYSVAHTVIADIIHNRKWKE